MVNIFKIKRKAEEGLKDFLLFLLETKKIEAVFILTKFNNNGVGYSLVKDKAVLKESVPLYPSMPANGGKMLSTLTLREPIRHTIAAVLRPCELRGFVELIKLNQASEENILFISYTCPGVYPLSVLKIGHETKIYEYWEKVKKFEIPKEVRPTCRACEHFLPYTSDITVSLFGENIDKETIFLTNTKKGEIFAEGFAGKIYREEKKFDRLYEIRRKEKKKLLSELDEKGWGIERLVSLFGRCISCYGCSKVCPICYCKLCDFNSARHEPKLSTYENELSKRGGIRVPTGILLYHLGRMLHVGISCVGCGMCTDVCPSEIPISTIFLKIGSSLQDMLGYIPGKDYGEEIPIRTFKTEEFTEYTA